MVDDIQRALAERGEAFERQSLDMLSELVVAAAEGPAAVESLITDAMVAAGFDVEAFDYDPHAVPLVDEFATSEVAGRASERCVVGRISGAGDGRSLLLFAHPDTEDFCPTPEWQSDPFSPQVRDGRLFGWGIADDLTGIAMLVRAPALLQRIGLRPKGDLVLVSAPSKRHRRGIAAALHRGLGADAAVYLHPAESGRGLDDIKAFAPGQLEFAITVSGMPPQTSEPVHTAFAHQAVNPFAKAALLADALRALDEARGRDVRHPRLEQAIGRSVNLMLTFCAFGAADRLGRMAPVCRLGGAMTLVPGERLDDVMAEVERVVRAAAAADPWLAGHPVDVTWLAGVSAAETTADSPIHRTVAEVLVRSGASPRVNPLHTSSDIRNPIVQKGIQTVGFGPLCGGLAMCGLADEWVDVVDYHRAIVATARLVAAWCGTEPT